MGYGINLPYLPLAGGGWMYLVAIIELYSRYIVGWSLSNTMTFQWCKACLQAAIAVHGEPEIVNTDQGSQFTSHINPWDIRDQKMYMLKQPDFSFPARGPEKKTNLTLKNRCLKEGSI